MLPNLLAPSRIIENLAGDNVMVVHEDPELREILVELEGFLESQSILTLATSSAGAPYATPLFYCYERPLRRLLFVSNPASQHCRELAGNPTVAAGIYRDTVRPEEIRGVQIVGIARQLGANEQSLAQQLFSARHPQTRAKLSERSDERFFELRVQWAKFTDNTRGFGYKQTVRFVPGPVQLLR